MKYFGTVRRLDVGGDRAHVYTLENLDYCYSCLGGGLRSLSATVLTVIASL